MFLVMFPKLGNICFGRKIWVREAKTADKNIFCFRAAKFVSATHVSRWAKLGNICFRNNVSPTMFPSLARPYGFWVAVEPRPLEVFKSDMTFFSTREFCTPATYLLTTKQNRISFRGKLLSLTVRLCYSQVWFIDRHTVKWFVEFVCFLLILLDSGFSGPFVLSFLQFPDNLDFPS